jgi:cyclophilin family peptidyl-prolyl cis-trans isomerase
LLAERQGFEPWMSFWPILTFQASAFDHSATAPHALECGRPSAVEGVSQGVALCKVGGMKKLLLIPLLLAAAPAPPAAPKPAPSPNEIVATAKAEEWVTIAPSDLLVMDLALDTKGKARRVVIQLMPAPFSQGWVGNIRKLAAAKYWDGTSVYRVQDNYVAQWGDVTEKKALPEGLATVGESAYELRTDEVFSIEIRVGESFSPNGVYVPKSDPYHKSYGFVAGIPVALSGLRRSGLPDLYPAAWPVHCYAMVGVARDLSPNTGSGSELYTVIGHAPRHLDRNIALVGRVIEGIEHLSSLPRGTGALGFYEKVEERVAITSVRLASEMVSDKSLPAYQYLSTESATFAKYADARANRRDPFFIKPAGGADICNIPVPIRRAP